MRSRPKAARAGGHKGERGAARGRAQGRGEGHGEAPRERTRDEGARKKPRFFTGTKKRPQHADETPVRARGEARSKRDEEPKPAVSKKPQRRIEVPAPVRAATQGPPRPNEWLFTTREGSEQDLIDELLLAKVVNPPARVIAPALVASPTWPKREKRPIDLTFARQGFPVAATSHSADFNQLVDRLSRAIINKLGGATQYALHVWVPDSTEANPLASMADELDARIAARVAIERPSAKRIDDATLRRLSSVPFAQVCLMATDLATVGVSHSNQAPSLAKGGRTRVRVTGDLPSRAARKIEEALAWIGVSPGPGEVCVDLGAAPGGWTYVLSEKRAKVIAVDPAKLRPEIAAKKNVEHVMGNAFTYAPDGQVDWLFCDMAYRPLEVAAMLARWGRRRWARMLVANIKLPMKKKAEILARVMDILEREGEWKGVRAKQLYHDRDEITLTAHVA